MNPVLRHQQPPREPGFHDMEPRATGGLREFTQVNERIPVDHAVQRFVALNLHTEPRRIHAQRRTATLHDGAQRRDVHAEYQRDSEHAFVSDQAHLETGRPFDGHNQ